MTIQQIYNEILNDLQSEMGVQIPVFGKSFLRAIAAVQAAKLYIFYLSADFIKRNTLPDTADSVEKGGTLQRWGRIILGRFQFAATQAQYQVEVTGDVGATIDAQTTFQSRSTAASPNKLYIIDADYTLTATTDTITLRALEAGRNSQLEIGDELVATVPIAGVNKSVEVVNEITEPQDGESDELYRARLLEALRTEPQGGAAVDYRIWSNTVDGVAQSYPYASLGVNTAGGVDVYVEATVAASTDGKGTPTTATINEVESVIKLNPDTNLPMGERGRKPLGVDLNVLTVAPLDVEVEISGFQNLDSTKEAAIRAQINALVADIRPFVEAVDNENERNDTLTLNAIISAITIAVPGSVFGAVELKVNGSVVTSYEFIRFEIPFSDDSLITFV